MAAPNIKDLATSVVTVAPLPVDTGTTLSVVTSQGARLPTAPFIATLVPNGQLPTLDNAEMVTVTAKSGDALTIQRAYGDTTAKNISVGWRLFAGPVTEHIIGAYEYTDTQIAAIDYPVDSVNGQTGTVVISALPPNGSAGGDLTGTYPSPTLAAVGTPGLKGSASSVPVFTTDTKGRVTANTNTSIQIAESQVTNLTTDIAAKVSKSGDTMTGDLTLSGANETIDGSNGSKILTLKSSFNGQDDNGAGGHYDSTSRLILQSYQRAGTNNYGEVAHIESYKWPSKQMIAYYMPDAYNGTTGDPIGPLNAKVWMGAHAQATGGDSNHNHWEIETHDSKGYMRGRFTVDFAATTTVDGTASNNDPASPGIGLDKTYIATNQADFIVRTNYPTFQAGDTTIPTGSKLASALRLTGSSGIAQDIQFAHDFYGSDRRWALRNSADIESQVATITGSPTGGTFTLMVNGQTTSGIAYNASAATVQTALNALSTVVSGCTVTGSSGGPWTISYAVNTLAWTLSTTASGIGLTGGSSPTITMSRPNTGSNFQLIGYDDTGTIIGTLMNVDRATGLITVGSSSAYRTGGILINKSNTGNGLKIADTFTGGTLYYGTAADVTSRILSGDVTADTSQRIVIYADGKHEWGSGSASRDTNLYRSTADNLKTDDKLTAALGLDSGSNKITNVADPTSAQDAATKAYVDTSLATKQSTLTLTTTGTSGIATLVGATLNVPNYSAASGGITRSVNNISINTTAGAASATDYVYIITSLSPTLTLPTAVGNTNRYTVINTGAGTPSVATTSSQTINGSSTASIPLQNMSLVFISDNANWHIE